MRNMLVFDGDLFYVFFQKFKWLLADITGITLPQCMSVPEVGLDSLVS